MIKKNMWSANQRNHYFFFFEQYECSFDRIREKDIKGIRIKVEIKRIYSEDKD